MPRTPSHRLVDRRRRAAGHTCAACQRPWALRASVETTGDGDSAAVSWVVHCRYCDYQRVVVTVEERALPAWPGLPTAQAG